MGCSLHPVRTILYMIKEIIDTFESITKSKLKYLVIIILICLIAFPFIDKIFIKNYVIEQKISLARNYSELIVNKVDNEVSNKIIASIENDIGYYLQDNKQEYNPVKSVKHNLGKFISGIFLWVIVFVMMIFSKEYKARQKIATLISIIIIGFISGYLSSIIPIIVNPIINYIGYNVLELLLVYSLIPNKKKT